MKIAITAITLISCLFTCTQTSSAETFENSGTFVGHLYLNYMNETNQSYGMQIRADIRGDSSRFEYAPTLFAISGTNREDVLQYSFQGVVNLTSLLVTAGINGLLLKPGDYSIDATKLIYITLLPSSAYRYRVAREVAISLEINTEYRFVRSNGSDRGMVITTALGIAKLFHTDNEVCRASIQLTAGPNWFVNFDGASQFDGVSANLALSMGMFCD